jgi:pyrimidine operon attenuation protein / uracil phosphoribosyltransferase
MSAPASSTESLPDPEALLAKLCTQLRAAVTPDTALVGIYTGGVWLANRLHSDLQLNTQIGTLDVTFYRDDFGRIGLHPNAKRSEIGFEVEGCHIILVDDVLYTGRTIRAAMNELFDYGRPASIQLAVLIDRDERELPIAAQFVGAKVSLPHDEIAVLEQDANGKLRFKLERKA